HRVLLIPVHVRVHPLRARPDLVRDGGRGQHPRRGRPAHHAAGDPAAGPARDHGCVHRVVPRGHRALRRPRADRAARALPGHDHHPLADVRVPAPRAGGRGLCDAAPADHRVPVLAPVQDHRAQGLRGADRQGRRAAHGAPRPLALAWGRGFSFDNVTLRNLRFVLFDQTATRAATVNTFVYAGAASIIALILALAIAYIVARRLVPLGRVLTYVAMAPFVIP